MNIFNGTKSRLRNTCTCPTQNMHALSCVSFFAIIVHINAVPVLDILCLCALQLAFNVKMFNLRFA